MWTIRQPQMEALRAAARARLEERVMRHLRARSPQRCEQVELRAEAARLIALALKHEVNTVDSIAFLCGWLFDLGDGFESSPAGDEALEILRSSEYPGQIKVQLIDECLTAASRGRTLVIAG